MMRTLLGLLTVAGLAILGLLSYGNDLLKPRAVEPSSMIFEVARGDTLGEVAARLETDGLIRSALAARLWARFEGIDGRLHVGEYDLSPHQSTREILDAITSGRVRTYAVTVPEGTRATEIAGILERAGLADAQAFMTAVNDPALVAELGLQSPSLEGYLYPDTYTLPRGLDAREVARVMVRQFEKVWSEQIEPLSAEVRLSKPEIVTLASIVEKETAAPEERPRIAAVFLNRLDRGMRLETDPTVIYGIEAFDGNLKKRHLLDGSNPYNTYRISGLPPGPIASPGVEALRAVVRPEQTDYLYFVSMNDGTHYFSTTYGEHVNAVNRYQKRRRTR